LVCAVYQVMLFPLVLSDNWVWFLVMNLDLAHLDCL